MEPLLPRHKRTVDLRQSAYDLKEALNALLLEHNVLSDVYQALMQTRPQEALNECDSQNGGAAEIRKAAEAT